STYSLYGVKNPVVLWDVKSRREITPGWMEKQHDAVFAPRLDELLTLDENGSVVVWGFADIVNPTRPAPRLGPLGKNYRAAAMSPNGEWIAAVEANDIVLWRRSALDGEPRRLCGHRGAVKTVEFSPDSQSLVSAGDDRTARVWSVDSQRPTRILDHGHSA